MLQDVVGLKDIITGVREEVGYRDPPCLKTILDKL